ncbi:MAG: transcriptional repressor [Parvularculaceae bacterium]|nr:transcriptional repressor [Parvularculaceae bacterium]
MAHDHFANGDGEDDPRPRPLGLTKNESMVWDVLDAAGEPLKAYDVLDRLKARGVRAPMTVYRALDGLVGKGFVHKLDALNAYMICNHDHPHDIQAFLVCDQCAGVTEFEIDHSAAGFQPVLRKTGFDMQSARLEVHGVCQDCAGAAALAP